MSASSWRNNGFRYLQEYRMFLAGQLYRTGGSARGKLSLHDMSLEAKRVRQDAKREDIQLLYHQTIFAEEMPLIVGVGNEIR